METLLQKRKLEALTFLQSSKVFSSFQYLFLYISTKCGGPSSQAMAWLQPWEPDFRGEPPSLYSGRTVSDTWNCGVSNTSSKLKKIGLISISKGMDRGAFQISDGCTRPSIYAERASARFICTFDPVSSVVPLMRRDGRGGATATESWLVRCWKILENSSGWRNKIHRAKVEWRLFSFLFFPAGSIQKGCWSWCLGPLFCLAFITLLLQV